MVYIPGFLLLGYTTFHIFSRLFLGKSNEITDIIMNTITVQLSTYCSRYRHVYYNCTTVNLLLHVLMFSTSFYLKKKVNCHAPGHL